MTLDVEHFVETWKGIAAHLHRSERWCRNMTRVPDPLPVFRVGGVVRLRLEDLQDWLERRRDRGMAPTEDGLPEGRPMTSITCYLETRRHLEHLAVGRGVSVAEILEEMMHETPAIRVEETKGCNRHADCAAAEAEAESAGRRRPDHCHDDCCEDCFGS